MKRQDAKVELQSSFGSILTHGNDINVNRSEDFGSFSCSVENFDHFLILRRNFETSGESLSIPFTCSDPCVQMIFSLDGQSFFNDRHNPFHLGKVSHCINFFRSYQCTNLLDEHSKQQDITFRLKKNFYSDLITNHLSTADDRLPQMIYKQKEFNTINEHLPADQAIMGILKNIMECPFKDEMRTAFIREHVRALLMLQIFHFNPIVGGNEIKMPSKITRQDREILEAIRNHIDEHFLDPASLENLSRLFGINEFKLKNGFRTLFETSPIRYLQKKRLEFSICLLRDTDKSIKQIADEIGYAHAANYTAAFTRAFGYSPLHFRERNVDVMV